MAKRSSSGRHSGLSTLVRRLVIAVMVVLLVPFAIGLLTAVVERLDGLELYGGTAGEWAGWGFATYLGLHLLLYRAVGWFRASHRVFSTLAQWLFGSQVTSVEQAGGGGGKTKSRGSKGGEAAGSEGSTLVAFSPYVIPVYAVLTCVIGSVLQRWWNHSWIPGAVMFFVGLTMGFHWLMTADELQQQRERWYIETYLLAIGIVFMLTVLVVSACLPLTVPAFSFAAALSEGMARAQAIYTALVNQLFF